MVWSMENQDEPGVRRSELEERVGKIVYAAMYISIGFFAILGFTFLVFMYLLVFGK